MSHENLSEAEILSGLSAHVLLDMARNECASYVMRKAAVKLLMDKNFPEQNHPDLTGIRVELRHEREAVQEVESIVESQIEHSLDEIPALRAGFTTANLTQDDVIDNS